MLIHYMHPRLGIMCCSTLGGKYTETQKNITCEVCKYNLKNFIESELEIEELYNEELREAHNGSKSNKSN